MGYRIVISRKEYSSYDEVLFLEADIDPKTIDIIMQDIYYSLLEVSRKPKKVKTEL